MRTWILALALMVGCAGAPPQGVNIRGGRGYCPICADWHDAAAMQWRSDYQGKTYWFCDPNCKAAFEQHPEKYLRDPIFNPTEMK
jgi:YHS domain-containing protein